MKIIDHVYVVPKVVANPYIIVDSDGLTIIDTGLPGQHKKILAYISNLGKSARDIKRIILTHSDLDHIGSLYALQKVSGAGARTYTSKIEAEAIAAGKPSREVKPRSAVARILFTLLTPFFKATPIQIDEIVRDGQILPILGGLQVVESPGHTPGHISLFSTSTGILFCGDSMVAAHGLEVSRPAVTWDQEKARESVKRQAALGARIVCSGHGPVVMDAEGKFPSV
jgi:glyoxylase-like metal-dependent hydrolase (beta-lactamase superfamily II)